MLFLFLSRLTWHRVLCINQSELMKRPKTFPLPPAPDTHPQVDTSILGLKWKVDLRKIGKISALLCITFFCCLPGGLTRKPDENLIHRKKHTSTGQTCEAEWELEISSRIEWGNYNDVKITVFGRGLLAFAIVWRKQWCRSQMLPWAGAKSLPSDIKMGTYEWWKEVAKKAEKWNEDGMT